MRGTSFARRSAGVLAAAALAVGPAGCGSQDRDDAEDRRCAVDRPSSGRLTVGNPTSDEPTLVIPGPTGGTPTGGTPTTAGAPGEARPMQTLRAEPAAVSDRPDATTITYRFTGDGIIGWSAKPVAMGMTEGREEPVPIAGACTLQVDFSLSRADDTEPGRLRAADRPAGSRVTDLYVSGPRGGILQSFVGTSALQVSARATSTELVLTLR